MGKNQFVDYSIKMNNKFIYILALLDSFNAGKQKTTREHLDKILTTEPTILGN